MQECLGERARPPKCANVLKVLCSVSISEFRIGYARHQLLPWQQDFNGRCRIYYYIRYRFLNPYAFLQKASGWRPTAFTRAGKKWSMKTLNGFKVLGHLWPNRPQRVKKNQFCPFWNILPHNSAISQPISNFLGSFIERGNQVRSKICTSTSLPSPVEPLSPSELLKTARANVEPSLYHHYQRIFHFSILV